MSHVIVVFSHCSGRKLLVGLLGTALLMQHTGLPVVLQLWHNQEI